MLKHKNYIVAAIMVIALSLCAASCTMGSTTNDLKGLRGILNKVDSISGEVSVILNDGSIVTFNLKDVNVKTISKTLGYVSLEKGSEVTIFKDKRGKITDMNVLIAEVEGIIKRINLAKHQVSITLDERGQITLNVTNTTTIMFGSNVNYALSQLTEGQRIEATYYVANKNALELHVYLETDLTRGEVRGKIASIDTSANTITIQSENGTTTRPLKIVPETKLWLDKVGTSDSLYVGMEVKVKYNPDTGILIKLEGRDTRSPVEKFLEESN